MKSFDTFQWEEQKPFSPQTFTLMMGFAAPVLFVRQCVEVDASLLPSQSNDSVELMAENVRFTIPDFPSRQKRENLTRCLIFAFASAAALLIAPARSSESLNVSETGNLNNSSRSAFHLQAML